MLGPARATDHDHPLPGGEDLSDLPRAVPGAYSFICARPGDEDTPVCHHPDFDFDDELIPTGMAMFLGLCRDRLAALA